MTSPLEEMAHSILIQKTLRKTMALGRQSYLCWDMDYVQGRKCWLYGGYLESRHQEIAPTTPRELDVRAMVHFLQVWCDANWHHMFLSLSVGLGDDKSSLYHPAGPASTKLGIYKTSQYTLN